jgi:hypothetical protein
MKNRILQWLTVGVLACACQNRAPEGVKSGDCTDGKDNDLDGQVDCKDDGCSMFTSCINESTNQGLLSSKVRAAAKKAAAEKKAQNE